MMEQGTAIKVRYGKIPLFCNSCSKLGHMEIGCLAKEKIVDSRVIHSRSEPSLQQVSPSAVSSPHPQNSCRSYSRGRGPQVPVSSGRGASGTVRGRGGRGIPFPTRSNFSYLSSSETIDSVSSKGIHVNGIEHSFNSFAGLTDEDTIEVA